MHIIIVLDIDKIDDEVYFRETTEASLINQTDLDYSIRFKNDNNKKHFLALRDIPRKKTRPDFYNEKYYVNFILIDISYPIILRSDFIETIKSKYMTEDITKEFILEKKLGKLKENIKRNLKHFIYYTEKDLSPNIILSSPTKCGTTGLYYQLNEMPHIPWNITKEIEHYKESNSITKENYLLTFPVPRKNEHLLYFNPNIFLRNDIFREIKKDRPDSKLIFIMRNPVDRLLSQYIHYRSISAIIEKPRCNYKMKTYYPEDYNYIYTTKWWKGEKRKLYEIIKEKDFESIIQSNYFLSSNYLPVIKKRIELFGKENIYFMVYEDLVKNYNKEVEKLYSWITGKKHKLSNEKQWLNSTNMWLDVYNPKIDITEDDINFLIDYYDGYDKEIGEYLGIDIDWSEFKIPEKLKSYN